jgi:hypothetical protein
MATRHKTTLVGSLQVVLCSAVLLALQACTTTPTIGDITFSGMTARPANFCQPHHGPGCAATLAEFPAVAELRKQIIVRPMGKGVCGLLSIDFGDGTPPMTLQNLQLGDAANPGLGVQHTYNGWPGRKRVRVKGLSNCLGDETKMLMVTTGPLDHGDFDLGFVPNNMVCNAVPNVPPLRKGTTVRIVADVAIQYGPFINFDSGGEPGVAAPSDFAFPGMGKFAVIYRLGSQLVQGVGRAGNFQPVVFRVAATAPLEICLNDHPMQLGDNGGAGRFTITVNEVTAD